MLKLKGDKMRKHHWIVFLVVIVAALLMPALSSAQVAVGVSVHIGPPAIPVYEQPICPGPGYLWTPGYWAYGPDDYYWVPGTWVVAPAAGLLWTPGYWGFAGGLYAWHPGYWGSHVGFYGGINYGFGYFGAGFVGGRWDHGVFAYNTAVMHVNTVVIHNTYIDRTVIHERDVNRVSFNGGPGGINARATREEERYAHERHVEATHDQMAHEHAASMDRSFRYSENHGRPAVAASARPGEFHGREVASARPNNGSHSFNPPNHNEAAAHSNNGGHATHASNANAGHSFNPPNHNEPGGHPNNANNGHSFNAPNHNEGGNGGHQANANHAGGQGNPRPEERSNPHDGGKGDHPHR